MFWPFSGGYWRFCFDGFWDWLLILILILSFCLFCIAKALGYA